MSFVVRLRMTHKTILVTGGLGYIGSHTIIELLEKGYTVLVFDNASKGHAKALDPRAHLIVGDLADKQKLYWTFSSHHIDAVIHFAGSIEAGESMKNPAWFYENNLVCSLHLLEAMRDHAVQHIVFSSTAAIFGDPKKIPIEENHPIEPVNCYGATKAAIESMLSWFEKAHGITHVALRYFNAAGSSLDALRGEDHDPETHLFPLVFQVALGQRTDITIFGDDYPTDDGTCIRDYVHVVDLAKAHVLALDYLQTLRKSDVFNLGSGEGYSVRQIIDTIREVTGASIPVIIGKRRDGDPPRLIASNKKARSELGWTPAHSDIRTIAQTAWEWHRRHPRGYADMCQNINK